MWLHMNDHTGAALYRHLRAAGREIPDWLLAEIPDEKHVPPKSDVAAAIYKAMVEAAPSAPAEGGECTGCRGNGEIGGLTPTGYDSDTCPHCNGSGKETAPEPLAKGEAKHERDALAKAIAKAAIKCGLLRPDIEGLTGPQLLMIVDDMATALNPPQPSASVSARAREYLARDYDAHSMPETAKLIRNGSPISADFDAALRAIEQALTQQRGECEAVAWTERERQAIADMMATQEFSYTTLMRQAIRLYQHDLMRRKDGETCTWSGDEQRAREFAGTAYTPPTPQPSADAVLVPRGAAETARTVAEEWLAMFSDIPGLEKYERYTYGPAVEQLRDELESLLGRGG